MLSFSSPPSHPAALAADCETRIQLCGTLIVEIAGRRVDHLLPGRKGRQLFACLLIGRDRPISRDELIDAVWPDDSPADPDGTLSTLLTRLRSAVGRELIQGRGELLLDLGDGAWVDWDVAHNSVGESERLLVDGDARGALEVACAGLEIARQPLLAGISTPWLEDHRRDLVEACAALLETAARAALRLGRDHLPVAERSARELIEREPYRESAYGLLMEIHAARATSRNRCACTTSCAGCCAKSSG
jgi:DNA-binding SARP family transcriptional activator